jgi:hypothetical protein
MGNTLSTGIFYFIIILPPENVKIIVFKGIQGRGREVVIGDAIVNSYLKRLSSCLIKISGRCFE